MSTLIIGAGPTGLGAAHRLNELGETDWLLVEQQDYFGGLATSFIDEQGFTWDFAVHVAHSHYHYVDDLMDRLLPDGFYHHVRKSWVREYQAYIPYPFQNNIRHLPETQRDECVRGLQNRPGNQAPSPSNFEDWILAGFGEGIAKHFMLPYNRKIWCTEPRDMGYQWIGDRVPTIDVERIIENIRLEKDDVAWGPNHTFQFPREGGTGAIWKALGESLPSDRVRLNCRVESLDTDKKTAVLSDGTKVDYEHLVSTMPLPVLTRMTGKQDLQALADRLSYTHVQVAGVAPNEPIPESLSDKTWIYCPDKECRFYRVTPFSIFSPAHVPDPDQWCSFLVEFSTPAGQPMIEDDLGKLAIDGMKAIGLMDINPNTTHFHHMASEYGYPVPTSDRDEILDRLQPRLQELGIYSRGRFGGWKYEVANMDHSLMQGVEAINHIKLNEEEVTLPTPHIVNAGKR